MLRRLTRGLHFNAHRLRLPSQREIASYTEQYRRSLEEPEDFWAEVAQEIEWFKPWSKILDSYVAGSRTSQYLMLMCRSVAARAVRRRGGLLGER